MKRAELLGAGAGALALAAVLGCEAAPARDGAVSTKPAAGQEGPASTSPTVAGRRTILFLGTSLTAGLGLDPDSAYPQQLQRKIDEKGLPYQTVNGGVSGETSAGLLRRLDWVLQQPAALIVVETGANDGLRGLDPATTKATIGQVLARIRKERPEAELALVQMEAPTNLGVAYTRAFRAMYPELARRYGATLLPFLLDGVAGIPSLNQADGVHPNLEGERVVASTVWRAVEPLLGP